MADNYTTSISPERVAHTCREVEDMLGISHTLLYSEIGRGAIRTFKIRNRRLITPDALAEYIAERERETGGVGLLRTGT